MEAVVLVAFIWYAINKHRELKLLEEISDTLYRIEDLNRKYKG